MDSGRLMAIDSICCRHKQGAWKGRSAAGVQVFDLEGRVQPSTTGRPFPTHHSIGAANGVSIVSTHRNYDAQSRMFKLPHRY